MTNREIFKNSCKNLFSTLPGILKTSLPVLLPLFLVAGIFRRFMGGLSSDYSAVSPVLVAVTNFTFEFGFALVISAIVPVFAYDVFHKQPIRSLTVHFNKWVGQLTIESFRVMLYVFIGFLMLIIPGLIRIITTYFVVLVVQFDPRYEENKVDALKVSAGLVKGHFLAFAAYILLSGCLSMGFQILQQKYMGQSQYLHSTVLFLVDYVFEVAIGAFSYFLFYERLREVLK